MKRRYKTIHTNISNETFRILTKFTKSDSYLFKNYNEVIEIALLMLDSIFKSDEFKGYIKTLEPLKLFESMNPKAKKRVLKEFIRVFETKECDTNKR